MLESYGMAGVKKVNVGETEDWKLGWVAKGGKEGREERRKQEADLQLKPDDVSKPS